MACIRTQNLSVSLPVYSAQQQSFRNNAIPRVVGGKLQWAGKGKLEVSALKDLSVSLEDGDRVGLIGPNGAGKSTLLRVLAGVYQPTSGRLDIEGEVTAMMSTQLGMEMDDTGYQNIYNIGMLLGMSKTDIDSRIEDVVAFTELGEFLGLPVRTYSTGMRVRLAFAIATSVRPEILLLDEGIGAGDAKFARKARERVDDMMRQTNILVIASHSASLLRRLCNKALYLEKGELCAFGDLDEVMDMYHEDNGER